MFVFSSLTFPMGNNEATHYFRAPEIVIRLSIRGYKCPTTTWSN